MTGFNRKGKLALNEEVKNEWKWSSLGNVEAIVGTWEAVIHICLENSQRRI